MARRDSWIESAGFYGQNNGFTVKISQHFPLRVMYGMGCASKLCVTPLGALWVDEDGGVLHCEVAHGR